MNDQVIALSGLLQSCYLVDKIARTGTCDQNSFVACIESLFVTDPKDTLEVFGTLKNIEQGLQLTQQLAGKTDNVRNANWLKYALTILHLEPKLSNDQAMLSHISSGISQAKSPKAHFGTLHENTIASLARTYQETVSTFRIRVQVSGKPEILQTPTNAAKIRALLLASARSAILWRQVKGHRWHLLFKRKQLLNSSSELLRQVEYV